MPTSWRLIETTFASTAFTGEGALLSRGRWHSPGTRIVYTADSRALAVLEVLTRLRGRAPQVPYSLIGVTYPVSVITHIDPATLPDNWRAYTGPAPLQALGDAWIASKTSLVLRVPSAVIPEESNYLINPEHPEVPLLATHPGTPFRFDLRLIPQPT